MKPTLAQVALLVLAVAGVYSPTLQNGYVWDDETNIHQNETLTQPDALRRIWTTDEIYQYYPLTFTSYHLEYLTCGRQFVPAVTHAINGLLHALNAIALMFLCRRLGLGSWTAWLAAALFAVHPIEVESVAWATERKNLLGGLFFLCSMLTYCRFTETERRRDYALSLALFLLAGLSKTVTMTLPASLILIELCIRHTRLETIARRMIPFLILGFVFAVVAKTFEHNRAGAEFLYLDLSLLDRIRIACRVPWHYAWNILVPRSPVFIPPRWEIAANSWQSYWPVALTALTLTGLIAGRRRLAGLTVFAIAHFFVTLLPASGLVDFVFMRYSYVQDHFQYLAGIGLLIVVAQVAARIAGENERLSARRLSASVIIGALLIALATISHRRCRDFYSTETLWRDTLKKNPAAWIAAFNLGKLLADSEDPKSLPEAEALFLRAVGAEPDRFEAYIELGIARARLGRTTEAIESLEHAVRLRPDFALARYNFAQVLILAGRTTKAILEIRTAIGLAEQSGQHELAAEMERAVMQLESAGQ
jgi:hypothetical protein